MRSFTLLSFALSLAALCIASQAINDNHSLHSRASNSSAANTTCASGVHMIVARASTEAPGEGIIGAVATQVQQSVPGSDSEAVVYPATLTDYLNSEASGVAAMTQLIQSYVARCPSSKIALLGYSQGAQVVGDVLCGTGEKFFNTTAALSTSLSKNIVAVIQMGDPSHVPGLPQDVGNSTKAGIFPRNNTAACASTASITQSYCNSNDTFCDSGSSIPVHLSYVQVYGAQAAKFIEEKVGASNVTTTGTTNGNATSTGTSTGSSTGMPKSNEGSATRYNIYAFAGSVAAVIVFPLLI
ncbi:carbohydrate esterase family 5 protein [Stipitochalara longipes BDJ]|nr:carbohydrate esterase family 5 protein [Stipitochalara longipes BDJ]